MKDNSKETVQQVAPQDKVVADILEVATREFANHGLVGGRIERIQEKTRTSKRMIYYHFGSKEGLYRAVIEHAFSLARQVDEGFDPQAGTPAQALKKLLAMRLKRLVRIQNLFDCSLLKIWLVHLLYAIRNMHRDLTGLPWQISKPF